MCSTPKPRQDLEEVVESLQDNKTRNTVVVLTTKQKGMNKKTQLWNINRQCQLRPWLYVFQIKGEKMSDSDFIRFEDGKSLTEESS